VGLGYEAKRIKEDFWDVPNDDCIHINEKTVAAMRAAGIVKEREEEGWGLEVDALVDSYACSLMECREEEVYAALRVAAAKCEGAK